MERNISYQQWALWFKRISNKSQQIEKLLLYLVSTAFYQKLESIIYNAQMWVSPQKDCNTIQSVVKKIHSYREAQCKVIKLLYSYFQSFECTRTHHYTVTVNQGMLNLDYNIERHTGIVLKEKIATSMSLSQGMGKSISQSRA